MAGRPSAAMLEEAFRQWNTHLQEGLAAMSMYRERCLQGGAPGGDRSVSLVSLPSTEPQSCSQLLFIQWTDAGVKGRVADMSDDHFLKCIVPVGKKRHPLDFQQMGGRIIIPQTGVKLIKDKQFARVKNRLMPNHVPDEMIHFMRMWRTAQSKEHDSGLETLLGDGCYICGCTPPEPQDLNVDDVEEQSASHGVPQHVDLTLSICPFCLLSSHQSCIEKLSHWLQQHHSAALPPAAAASSSSMQASSSSPSSSSVVCALPHGDAQKFASFPDELARRDRPGASVSAVCVAVLPAAVALVFP